MENQNDTGESRPKSEMSRGTQTGLIVAAVIASGLVVAYAATRLPSNDVYAKCQTVFGFDEECKRQIDHDAHIEELIKRAGDGLR